MFVAIYVFLHALFSDGEICFFIFCLFSLHDLYSIISFFFHVFKTGIQHVHIFVSLSELPLINTKIAMV